MFPLRDHNHSERTPYVTWALIAINIAVFLSYFPRIGDEPRVLMSLYSDWGLVPRLVSQGDQTHTIFTSMFLHGGWLHLAGNMLFLYIFGDNLEDEMGHVGYLIFYLASGVAAAFGQMQADPSSTVPMVGASGAIAGVMGGYLLLFPRARVDLALILFVIVKVITIPAWLLLGLWFALQLVSGTATAAAGGGVAYWAHAGGFVAGVLLTLPLWLKRGGPRFWQTTHGRPTQEGRDQEKRDEARAGRGAEPDVSAPEVTGQTRIPRAGRRRSGPQSPWGGRR